MTLDYKILWFEDQEPWYEAILPDISDYLSDQGFTLIPKRLDNGTDIDKIDEIGEYDLILMDYRLLNETGDVVIEKLRNLEIYTNVVFYSQDGEKILRDSIAAKGLDGVYCAHREQDEFMSKVNDIISITIKKVVDLNNVRGLVMAYTSELDLRMEEVIKEMITKVNDEEKANQKEKIKTKFIESLNQKLTGIQKLDSIKDFEKLFEIIDSSHKWRAIKRLSKKFEALNEYGEILEKYKEEVIDVRNILAHVRETIAQDGKKTFKSPLADQNEFEFNDAKAIEIRNNLRKHSETLQTISEII